MKDTIILLLLFTVYTISTAGAGFFFGRKYEQRVVKLQLPEVMDTLCQECYDMGEKKGKTKGIAMCDDVLNQIDNKGRY